MRRTNNKLAARTWQKKKRRKISLNFSVENVKKLITKRNGIRLAIVMLAASAGYGLLFADALRIKKVNISGNENVSSERLMESVRTYFSGKINGFIPADNYLFISEEKVGEGLKDGFAEIDTIEVRLKFPSQMDISIKEKNPALLWCRSGVCFYVNDQGVAYMQASEADLIKDQKQFIKIMEEAVIAEETAAGQESILSGAEEAEVGNENADNGQESAENPAEVAEDTTIEASLAGSSAVLPAIATDEKVADGGFVSFAVEISRLLSHNQKMKVKYFKTKGYRTRELIGYTDKNTRLYFDTTKSAEREAKNLEYLLSEGIDEEKIDTLQYIYLKNEDRVFYK